MEPIVYLDNEELVALTGSSDTILTGRAYEWEGEDVIHIHTAPLKHSYGKEHPALFVKGTLPKEAPVDSYVVVISDKDSETKEDAKLEPESDNNADANATDNADTSDNSATASANATTHTANNSETTKVYYITEQGPKELKANYIPAKADLYSRNKGILEINVLEGKRVMIVGLGSFGSQIAIELAKAGVGEFALFDFDRVELHNLARHTATTKDLGRLKTDVIEESIKGKNPYARVEKFPININEHLELMHSQAQKADIVICATDNNESRFNLSQVLVEEGKIGIFGRAVTRAEGGDVFRYRPGGPCYVCLIGNNWFGQMQEEITTVNAARERRGAYISDRDADALVQVGLSADIEPICNMMIKIALMELSRGTESGISSLEEELVYDYYMWANRRERRHKNWAPMPGAGAKPTIMRWYGSYVPRNESCALCSQQVVLDEGEDFLKEFGHMMQQTDLSDITLEE